MVSKRAAARIQTPTARAWRRYYRKTVDLRGPHYEDKEPWIWMELQVRLQKIKDIEEDDGA